MILVYFKFAVIKQGLRTFWSKFSEKQKNVFLLFILFSLFIYPSCVLQRTLKCINSTQYWFVYSIYIFFNNVNIKISILTSSGYHSSMMLMRLDWRFARVGSFPSRTLSRINLWSGAWSPPKLACWEPTTPIKSWNGPNSNISSVSCNFPTNFNFQ